jgi:hypothetical protein
MTATDGMHNVQRVSTAGHRHEEAGTAELSELRRECPQNIDNITRFQSIGGASNIMRR